MTLRSHGEAIHEELVLFGNDSRPHVLDGVNSMRASFHKTMPKNALTSMGSVKLSCSTPSEAGRMDRWSA